MPDEMIVQKASQGASGARGKKSKFQSPSGSSRKGSKSLETPAIPPMMASRHSSILVPPPSFLENSDVRMDDEDPLKEATQDSDARKLKRLLQAMDPHERTLKVNQFDNLGNTLIFHPSSIGDLKIVQVLLDYDADPNIQNEKLQTPLHLACEREHRQVMSLLVEYGAEPDLQDYKKKRSYEHQDLDPRIQIQFKKTLGDAREKYLEKKQTKQLSLITEEEKSVYKTMFDAMDEDSDNALTAFEMFRLMSMVPLSSDYKALGIDRLTMMDLKAFNDHMNASNHIDGVLWKDFLTYVHAFKQSELSSKKKKKGKKGKKSKK
mmetsp:Transcript_22149/g.39265  ORF Transcript_22149/g.39265 Transcript_22149/m.39265 type:complete len:320 (+) Transcript_22149:148-1107(+)